MKNKRIKNLVLLVLFVFCSLVSRETLAKDIIDYQAHLGRIKYPETAIYYSGKIGKGIKIAVIDDGVWLQHPKLSNQNFVNQNEVPGDRVDNDNNGYIDDYLGWNFYDNNSDITPKGSHGTAVAGLIVARVDEIPMKGVAPEAKIMPLIVCGSDGCPTQSIIEAIKYATDMGADIINLSLSNTNSYVGYNKDMDNVVAYAYNHNVVVVSAVGNGDVLSNESQGLDLSQFRVSPACNDVNGYNTVLGVAAAHDDMVHRTSWTNYGACVDVYAPGENIVSLDLPAFSNSGTSYKYWSGTSFSAPIVTGVVAFLRSTYPSMTVDDVFRVFKESNIMLNVSEIIYASSNKVLSSRNEKIILPVCEQGLLNKAGKCDAIVQEAPKNNAPIKLTCDDGLVENEGVCITHTENCSLKYGKNVYGEKDIIDGVVGSNCYCINGYEWDKFNTKCVEKNKPQQKFKSELKSGSKGKEVTELQNKLIKEGYLKAKANGNFGPATKAALIKYQKAKKIKATGVTDAKTREFLNK